MTSKSLYPKSGDYEKKYGIVCERTTELFQ